MARQKYTSITLNEARRDRLEALRAHLGARSWAAAMDAAVDLMLRDIAAGGVGTQAVKAHEFKVLFGELPPPDETDAISAA